jgi:hypothetical protein
VVEERILTQILYYLPQLYQLNRDLLRELEERVAHWYAPSPSLSAPEIQTSTDHAKP